MKVNEQAAPFFRAMQTDDADSVLALGKSSLLYVDLASSEPDPHNDYSASYIMSGLKYEDFDPAGPDSPLSMNFVAEVDHKVVGFVLAYIQLIGIPIIKICVLHAIVVDPDYHGHGISHQLLSQLQSRCREEDIQIMRILVRQQSAQLKKYLGSLGFQQNNVVIFDKLTTE
jgi:ribosomal protein S18 acetylase RimI-like enzyme